MSLRSFALYCETTADDSRVTALRDAYLDCWTDVAPVEQLLTDAALAVSVAPVGRALSWQRALVDAGAEERAEWQDSVWGWLEEMLPGRDKVGAVEQPVRRPAERTRGLGTTIFAEMSALATATGSVNLGPGLPRHRRPVEVVDGRRRRDPRRRQPVPARTGDPRAAGVRSPRHQRAVLPGSTYDPDTEVLVTTGATEAIAAALLGLVDPGDEVVVLEPYYDSYAAIIAFAGGVAVGRSRCGRRTSRSTSTSCARRSRRAPGCMLLNTPHNPTGTVLTRAELARVAEVAVEHDLVVVTDEVYEHLTYDGPARPAGHAARGCASAP